MRASSSLGVALTAVALLAACTPALGNFSQYPGFAEWYAAHPPASELPAAAEQALLERYLPRFYLAEGEPPPIDFYADYIGHGRLRDGSGKVVAEKVDRATLNRWKAMPEAAFEHQAPAGVTATHAVAYGRAARDRPPLPGIAGDWTFLTWNLVFAVSGLPADLPAWEAALVDLVASTRDWHQLDHYTAVTLALDEGGRPAAVTMQEHNLERTWVIGVDLALPPNGRLPVAIARRSNELYPRPSGIARYRTVDFGTPENMRYMMTSEGGPWMHADDDVEPGREIAVDLAFLPPDDAFYVFQGYLGERRWLPGRDGPPGADYNTLPQLEPRGLQMLLGYWREHSADDLATLAAVEGRGPTGFALAQAPAMARSLAAARRSSGEP